MHCIMHVFPSLQLIYFLTFVFRLSRPAFCLCYFLLFFVFWRRRGGADLQLGKPALGTGSETQESR
jgi:hypothetical protein